MTHTPVLLVAGRQSQRIGGMTLVERAAAVAVRTGFGPVHVHGTPVPPADLDALARRYGPDITVHTDAAPLAGIPVGSPLLALGPDALLGPEVVRAFASHAARPGTGPLAVVRDGTGLALYIPSVTSAMTRASSLDLLLADLDSTAVVERLAHPGLFIERVPPDVDARDLARRFIRHLNGRGEAHFTKRIRRYSVPLSAWLTDRGVRPSMVTLGGLLLAVLSALALAQGDYLLGLLGAAAYYASMVLDCSDGEVARLSVRDSAFGAWFETVVDYGTYVLVLTALFVATQSGEHAAFYRLATLFAAASSAVVIAVASYLRRRVAGADPGQFDDASASALAKAGRLHRFARWGRQWIKRSTMAHLIVAFALVGRLELLILLWAFGASLAGLVIIAVEPFVVRSVKVAAQSAAAPPLASRKGGTRAAL